VDESELGKEKTVMRIDFNKFVQCKGLTEFENIADLEYIATIFGYD